MILITGKENKKSQRFDEVFITEKMAGTGLEKTFEL